MSMMVRMSASRPPEARSVWGRKLVTVPELARDPDWPFGRTATYAMASRGEVPTRRLGEHVLVVMPELIRKLDLGTEMAA